MNSKQHKTLLAVFETPTRSDIRWADVESMLHAAGADVKGAGGSMVRVTLKGAVAVFHRPHPQPTAKKGAVKAVRQFLASLEIKP
jgi:hypothetical protein